MFKITQIHSQIFVALNIFILKGCTLCNVLRDKLIPVTTAGVYGDVQRVKILYKKKDSALIQMAEPHQAQLG